MRPFLRAAAALAAENFRPPIRLSSASHSGPANTEERRPGTLRSRSRLSQCNPASTKDLDRADIFGGSTPEIWYQPHRQRDRNPVRELDPQRVPFREIHGAAGSWLRFCHALPSTGRPGEIRAHLLLYPPRYQVRLTHWNQTLGLSGTKNCPKFEVNELKESL